MPVPVPVVEPFEIWATLHLYGVCVEPNSYKNTYEGLISKGLSDLGQVSSDDVVITSVKCQNPSPTGSTSIYVDYKISVLSQQTADSLQAELTTAFATTRGADMLKAIGINFSDITTSDPIILAPAVGASIKDPDCADTLISAVGIDMDYRTPAEWRGKFENIFRKVVYTAFNSSMENTTTTVTIDRVEKGLVGVNGNAVAVRFTYSGTPTPAEDKLLLADFIGAGHFTEALQQFGVEAGDVILVTSAVARPTSTEEMIRCRRCAAQRRFLPRADRQDSPESIQLGCAQGCSVHCSATCKRYHEPKEATCRTRLGITDFNLKLVRTALRSVSNDTSLVQVGATLRESTRHFADEAGQLLVSIEQATQEGSTELSVISLCFAQCSHTCVESCVKEWKGTSPRTSSAVKFDEIETSRVLNPQRREVL